MRLVIPAILVVGLFAASCGGSSPTPAPTVQVPPAESTGAPADPSPAAAQPSAYKLDLEALCNAPTRAKGAATASAEDRPRVLAEWISAQLQTDQAKDLVKSIALLEPARRPEVLRKEVEGQGIKTCPFADEMAAPRK